MGNGNLILVDSSALPEVFEKVLYAKQLLASSEAASASDAARKAGISRSAFYKYRDMVFPYESGSERIVTVHLILTDRPGVLSSVLSAFAEAGANVLTVNQNIPADGSASVSVSARTDRMEVPTEQFLKELAELPGVKRLSRIGKESTKQKKR